MAQKTVSKNGNGASTIYEEPPLSSIIDPVPDELETTTEYEQVEGLNLNVRNPDSEAKSGESTEGQLSLESLQQTGSSGEIETYDGPALDALHGSYDVAETFGTEVIIGADNRIRINPTTSYPWRAICALKITAANGRRYIGTGWLIGPRTVVTAGHCVFLHNEGGWARSIEVIPALNDAVRPYGSFSSNVLRSVTGWTQSRNRNFDYGAIILPSNQRPGNTVGFFGFGIRNDAFLRAANLNLSGYPGDKANGNQQWFMAQRPKSVSAKVITYEIDTMGGQSGAPVWVLENGARTAVGIHTNGHSSGNSGTRIDQSVYNNLLAWKNQGA